MSSLIDKEKLLNVIANTGMDIPITKEDYDTIRPSNVLGTSVRHAPDNTLEFIVNKIFGKENLMDRNIFKDKMAGYLKERHTSLTIMRGTVPHTSNRSHSICNVMNAFRAALFNDAWIDNGRLKRAS